MKKHVLRSLSCFFLVITIFIVTVLRIPRPLIATNKKKNNTNESKRVCISDLDTILDHDSSTVYITMPAKAAGTTMKVFTQQCGGIALEHNNFHLAHSNDKNPTLITSHLTKHDALQNLIEQQNRRYDKNDIASTTIIYLHREEQDRLKSATTYVVKKICRGENLRPSKVRTKAYNETYCQIPESDLQKMIRRRDMELQYGQDHVWTCGLHDVIQKKEANVDFHVIHYQQVNELQKALSKRFCPRYVDKSALHENVGTRNEMTVDVLIDNNQTNVASISATMELEKWMQVNRDQFLPKEPSLCQQQTKHIEEALLQCPTESISIG